MSKRLVEETPCEHGYIGQCNVAFTPCHGGSRRVLEPGELVDLINKHTQAIIDSLGLKNLTVAPGASVVIDLGLPLDALAEGEQ